MNILISTSSFGKYDSTPIRILEDNGFSVRLNPYGRKLTVDEVMELIRDVDGIIAGTEKLTREILFQCERLKVISRCGTGMDNVDVGAAVKKGIKVFRTPQGPAIAVAELTLGFMIDALRFKTYMDRKIKEKGWEKRMGRLLSGKTVGIIGLGYVGKKLVELLVPFGCNLVACDIKPDPEFAIKFNLRYSSFDELLKESHIVTVHMPLVPENHRLFDKEKFAQMRADSVFINTSRGELVDEDALFRALRDGKLGYACLDVYNSEPYKGELSLLENVTLTCHAGSYARESRVKMEIEAVENLIKGFEE